jgi:dephospho-CoA kinase
MTLRLGLTGGIGSGKSTVSALWVALGATLVDTDAIARSLTAAGGPAMPALTKAFGPDIAAPDGAMDRARMRDLVFNDSAAKVKLEGILHPMIGAEVQRQAAIATHAGAPVIVFDVPLLAESKQWRERVDRCLVIDCSQATQVQRVSQRPGWSEAAAQQVVAQQASRAVRRAVADAVIYNDGIDKQALQAAVQAVWTRWVTKSGPKQA